MARYRARKRSYCWAGTQAGGRVYAPTRDDPLSYPQRGRSRGGAELWRAAPGSDEAYELDALATLVDACVARQFPISPVEPLEALRLAISEMGRTHAELAEILGSRSRAGEVLSGKRALTIDMVRAICAAWRLPTDLLVGVGTAPKRRVGTDQGTRSKSAGE